MFDFIDWTQNKIKLRAAQRAKLFDPDLGWAEPCDGVIVISDRMCRHRRWFVEHEVIFTVDGAPAGHALRGHYDVPATECQEADGDGWSDSFEVVVAHTVQTIEYRTRE